MIDVLDGAEEQTAEPAKPKLPSLADTLREAAELERQRLEAIEKEKEQQQLAAQQQQPVEATTGLHSVLSSCISHITVAVPVASASVPDAAEGNML